MCSHPHTAGSGGRWTQGHWGCAGAAHTQEHHAGSPLSPGGARDPWLTGLLSGEDLLRDRRTDIVPGGGEGETRSPLVALCVKEKRRDAELFAFHTLFLCTSVEDFCPSDGAGAPACAGHRPGAAGHQGLVGAVLRAAHLSQDSRWARAALRRLLPEATGTQRQCSHRFLYRAKTLLKH